MSGFETGFFRVYVEKQQGSDCDASRSLHEFRSFLNVPGVTGVRLVYRYDVAGLNREELAACVHLAFTCHPSDTLSIGEPPVSENEYTFAVKHLPGVFDQRADSAAFCCGLLGYEAQVSTATVYRISGSLTENDKTRIKSYVINPVDETEADV
jgi:phosphoribosylformylglycinamidine synthase